MLMLSIDHVPGQRTTDQLVEELRAEALDAYSSAALDEVDSQLIRLAEDLGANAILGVSRTVSWDRMHDKWRAHGFGTAVVTERI